MEFAHHTKETCARWKLIEELADSRCTYPLSQLKKDRLRIICNIKIVIPKFSDKFMDSSGNLFSLDDIPINLVSKSEQESMAKLLVIEWIREKHMNSVLTEAFISLPFKYNECYDFSYYPAQPQHNTRATVSLCHKKRLYAFFTDVDAKNKMVEEYGSFWKCGMTTSKYTEL